MRTQDIPAHLGITAKALADLMGVGKSVVNDYTSGRKGVASKFITQMCAVANLDREEVFFPDVFDSPIQEDYHRYLNCAIECLRMAEKHGADPAQILKIQNEILRAGQDSICELYEEEL